MTDRARLEDAVAVLLDHPDTVSGWSRRAVRAVAWRSAEAAELVLEGAERGELTQALTEPLSALSDGTIKTLAHPTVKMLQFDQATTSRRPRDVIRELRFIEQHNWAQDAVTSQDGREHGAEDEAPYSPLGNGDLTPKLALWLKHLWWSDWTRVQVGWPGRLAVLLFLLRRRLPVSATFVAGAVQPLVSQRYFSIIVKLIHSPAIPLGARARWLSTPHADGGVRMLGVRAHVFVRSGPLARSRRLAAALWPELQSQPAVARTDFFLDGPAWYSRGRRLVLPMITESALQGARLQCLVCGMAGRDAAAALSVIQRPTGIATEFSAPGRRPALTHLQWLERLIVEAPPLVRRLALVELMTRVDVPGRTREAHVLRASRSRQRSAG